MATVQVKAYQGLGLFTVFSLLVLAALQPGSGLFALFPLFLIFLIWGVIVTPLAYQRERIRPQAKAKRGVQPDMYAMIDRMLAYLDANELAYLQRRLVEIEAAEQDEDFPATLEALLKQREANARRKLSGSR